MTPKERFACALNLGIPDRIPTFELEFQLSDELLGKRLLTEDDLKNLSPKETDIAIHENAEYMVKVFSAMEHDAICIHYLSQEHIIETARIIKKLTNDSYMIMTHGDGTLAISDCAYMQELAYAIQDDPESVDARVEKMCQEAIERNRRYMDGGLDGFILCCDYCFNKGPFISPKMFARFVTPYLARIIEDIRKNGGYAIKHTDGNIMKILDQLIECRPHALHSIDPMAGVDIKEVKELTRGKLALCGNVHCAAMQNGTLEEIRASAEYCLKYGKPGGGYVFATSNTPFKGMPLDRYLYVLDIYRQHRDY